MKRPLNLITNTPKAMRYVQKISYTEIGDNHVLQVAPIHIEIEKRASAHRYIPVKLTLIIKGGQCWAKLLAPPSPDRVGTAVKITKGCRKSLLLGVKYGTAIHPHRQQGAG